MKRARLLALVLVLIGGAVAWGQAWCSPCLPPPPPGPPCYGTFWMGEGILVELIIPWGIFCCNLCATTTMVLGWSVEAFGGGQVFAYTYPAPGGAATQIVWEQKDFGGMQVAPGFYKITVSTTAGDVSAYVKIVQHTGCGWTWRLPGSKPCGVSWCDPYLKLSRAPACAPWGHSSCDPCCFPWLFPWLFPFLFLIGK